MSYMYTDTTTQLLHLRLPLTMGTREAPKSHGYGQLILTYVLAPLRGRSGSQIRPQSYEPQSRTHSTSCMHQLYWNTHSLMCYSPASLYKMRLPLHLSIFPMQKMYMPASSMTTCIARKYPPWYVLCVLPKRQLKKKEFSPEHGSASSVQKSRSTAWLPLLPYLVSMSHH